MNFIKSLFTWQGRIGRKEFFINSLMLIIIFFALTIFLILNQSKLDLISLNLIQITLMIIFLILLLTENIKRFHDLNIR